MIRKDANENTTSRGGEVTRNRTREIDDMAGSKESRLTGGKLGEKTVRGGEAGLRKERNKELTSNRAPIDLKPPSKNSQSSN